MVTERPKVRSITSRRKSFLSILVVLLLACYASMNLIGSIFVSTKKETDEERYHPHRNATSSSSATAVQRSYVRAHDDIDINHVNKKANSSSLAPEILDEPHVHAHIIDAHDHEFSTIMNKSSSKTVISKEIFDIVHTTSVTNNTDSSLYNSLSISNGDKSSATYMQLPLPDTNTVPPISAPGNCGIGHRLSRNLATAVYAISHKRLLHVHWHDVGWNVIFNDTPYIKQGPKEVEDYGEGPKNWNESPLAHSKPTQKTGRKTAYDWYSPQLQMMFEMPLAHSIVNMLSENLSPLVLSYLEPMREQYAASDLHLCVHMREGNNETGDWERKEWRHFDLEYKLNYTLEQMHKFANSSSIANASKVTLFVASDNTKTRPWFEENTPSNWHIIKPGKEFPRPETGVWFGENGSKTNKNLTQDELNEALAEAAADAFALGECSALFIPTYSTFNVVGIILTRGRGRKVFFHWYSSEWFDLPRPQE